MAHQVRFRMFNELDAGGVHAKHVMEEYLALHGDSEEIQDILTEILRDFDEKVDPEMAESRIFYDPFDVLTFIMSSSRWRRLFNDWKKDCPEKLKVFMTRLFFYSVSTMVQNVTWNNCIYFKIADQMSKAFLSNNVMELEPYKTFETVEELILDDNAVEGLEQYPLVIWALIVHFSKNVRERFHDYVLDPTHICAQLEGDNMLVVKRKRAKIAKNVIKKFDLETSRLKTKSDAALAKTLQEVFQEEFEELDFCNGCEKFLENHQSYYFMRCLVRIMECNESEGFLTDAYSYADYIKEWIEKYSVRGEISAHLLNDTDFYYDLEDLQLEFYHLSYPEDYLSAMHRMLVNWRDTAENMVSVLPLHQDRFELFTGTFRNLEKCCVEDFEEVDVDFKVAPITPFVNKLSDKIKELRNLARIIVDPSKPKKVEKGVFHVQDFQTAIKIAKDGDIIFLDPGEHQVEPNPQCKVIFQVTKSVKVVGDGAWQTFLRGAFSVNVATRLSFHCLTLKLGEEVDAKEAYYVTKGELFLENCHIISPVNTMLYVMSPQKGASVNQAVVNGCVINGLDHCQRFASIDHDCLFFMLGCYVKNMYSVITVHDAGAPMNQSMSISACLFERVQDGIKMIVHHESRLDAKFDHVTIKLHVYDLDQPSHGLSFTGGRVYMRNVMIEANNADLVAFSLHSLEEAKLRNIIVVGKELDLTSTGKGLELSEIKSLVVRNICVSNVRIGIEISNELKEYNEAKVFEVSAKRCSIAMLVTRGKSTEKSLNMLVVVAKLEAALCYYGLMATSPHIRLVYSNCDFADVPKAILLHKGLKRLGVGAKSKYSYPHLSPTSSSDLESMSEADIEEKVRRPYYIKYSEEKMPFRVAYEHCDFNVISC